MNATERQMLGEFLRTRRARISPEELGLPHGRRRKTAGLRREEVAYLAGISVTWYTWIEQGREISISAPVLESLARVLHLSAHETDYLFNLAETHPKHVVDDPHDVVTPALRQILDHQGVFPAYLMGRFWDILAWNRAAVEVFGDWAAMPAAERNMLWYTFARPETRARVVEWETRAQRVLAEFRADCGSHLTDPGLAAILDRLRAASPEFAHWWTQHDVQTRDGGRREFDHPRVGRLALEQTTWHLSSRPGMKLILHVPLPEFESEAKLLELCKP